MQLRAGLKHGSIAVSALALDRASKLAVLRLLVPGASAPAIPGILSWVHARNSGAAFSLLSGSGILPCILSALLVMLLLLRLLAHPMDPTPVRIGLWLLLGGGLGNLWDRLVYGSVIDFIRVDFVHFAVFNVADVFVCIGAALVILRLLFSPVKG